MGDTNMNMSVKLSKMYPFIKATIENDKDIEIIITGTSMYPLLNHKKDSVLLTKIKSPLKKGDIILYKRDDANNFVLHRICKIKNGEYHLIGDHQTVIEKGIYDKNIIAVVKSFTRNNKVSKVNDFWHRIYTFFWLKVIPLRRYFLRFMKY